MRTRVGRATACSRARRRGPRVSGSKYWLQYGALAWQQIQHILRPQLVDREIRPPFDVAASARTTVGPMRCAAGAIPIGSPRPQRAIRPEWVGLALAVQSLAAFAAVSPTEIRRGRPVPSHSRPALPPAACRFRPPPGPMHRCSGAYSACSSAQRRLAAGTAIGRTGRRARRSRSTARTAQARSSRS
jgi:hypothetical protein